jgi:hypothetical protein
MQFMRVLAVAALLSCVQPLRAQELVDNPEFESWSKFKKGTSISMKSTNLRDNVASEVILTTTLLEVKADRVVIQSVAVVKGKDSDFKSEPDKHEILKSVPLPKGMTKADFVANKPPGTTEQGTETLKLAGVEIKATWFKYQVDEGGAKIQATRWVSAEVPGMIVKSEIAVSGKLTSNTKLDLLEIKKP